MKKGNIFLLISSPTVCSLKIMFLQCVVVLLLPKDSSLHFRMQMFKLLYLRFFTANIVTHI